VLRWLLPLFAVLTLLGSSLTAWAAAGFVGETSCCCPDKAKCKCHEHDGKGDAAPTLKRCSGEASWVAPEVTAAVEPLAPPPVAGVQTAPVATVIVDVIPDAVTIEIETPPF
jgi:hypothetical protein